jgi:hypothetical protein
MIILVRWVLLAGKFGLDLESVRAEVISLRLEQVCGQVLGAVTVKPAEGSAESWSWYTEKCSLGHDVSPAWLSLVDSLVEEVIEKKILKIRVFPISRRDILQENGSNDAATTPHERD